MKRKITTLSLSLLVMTLIFSTKTFAAFYACGGTPMKITGGGSFDVYTWDIIPDGGGTSVGSGTGQNFNFTTPTTPGKYTIMLTVKDNTTTCSSDPTPYELYVLPPITVTIDMGVNPTNYCSLQASTGTTLTLKATTPVGAVLGSATATSYQWYTTTGATGTITTGAIIPTATNLTYKVTESTANTYYYIATATYVVAPTDTFIGTKCLSPSAVQSIQVKASPTAPTITIVAVP